MADFVTLDDLRRFSELDRARELFEKARRRQLGTKTFLAHSSKDSSLLPGVILILEAHGAHVYVDLADNRMPKTANRETARILRSEISESRRLVVFVTTNSKDSKWVPWELGLGDGLKGARHVALFPAAEASWEMSWAGTEYLGLYSRIVKGTFQGSTKSEWMVLDHVSSKATQLGTWFDESFAFQKSLSYA